MTQTTVSATERAEIDSMTLSELGELISNGGYFLGQAVGFEEAARGARARSGEAYAQGKDELARFLREEAKTLDEQARRARARFDGERHAQCRIAFERLEAADNARQLAEA